MDEKTLTCEACGGKAFASPEEMDQHKKDAHGGEEGGSKSGQESGGDDHDHEEGHDH